MIHLRLEGRNDKVNGPGSFLKRWEGFKVDTVFVAASGRYALRCLHWKRIAPFDVRYREITLEAKQTLSEPWINGPCRRSPV